MKVAVTFANISLLDMVLLVGVWCALVSMSHQRQEEGNDLADGRGRLKRNSENTRVYKDAIFTSANTAYFQKHQTHHLPCLSWRQGEKLSSVFWYRDSTFVAEFSAPNERGKNFTISERYRLVDNLSGLIIHNVTDDDRGLYDCRVVPMATQRERKGMITVKLLDSTFPAVAVSMDSINKALLLQNINRQNGGRIKCSHSTTDAAATYWSLDKGEGVDTDIIGAEYSNKDTLVLDNYKEDYKIASGGDLQILSLQRPQSRFWCHRFLNGMAVGYVNVTGVVVASQNQPLITGSEPLPGVESQVNFDPDEDLQLECSVVKVYPKVTLVWEDVSKCDTNFEETSFESFDNVAKTYDQYQRLIVKAGSSSTDCQSKFVCNATGVAIPYQPFSAVVIPVKSGVSATGIILGVIIAVISLLIAFVVKWRWRIYLLKTSASSEDIEVNEIKSDDSGCYLCQVFMLGGTKAMESTTEEHGATQQACDESITLKNHTPQSEELKPVEEDESKSLLLQTSQPEEPKLDGFVRDAVEFHPSGSSRFSPRKWFMQAQNMVVHIHQSVAERSPERNHTKPKQKKQSKPRTTHTRVRTKTEEVRVTINEDGAEAAPSVPLLEASSETQTSIACHVTSSEIQDDVLQVHNQQSSAPEPSQFSGVKFSLRGIKRDNTELPSSQSISKDQFEMTDLSTLKREPRDEGDVSALHEASVNQETSDTHDDPKENDDQQKSSSETACKPQQQVEPHHDIIIEEQPEQQNSDEAYCDLHQTQVEVNLQRENSPEASNNKDEDHPSDSFIAPQSETQTSTASDGTSSETQDDVEQDDNQQSNVPEPSQVDSVKISPNCTKSERKSPPKKKTGNTKKKALSLQFVPKRSGGRGKPAAKKSKQPCARNIDNGTYEEKELERTGDSSCASTSNTNPLSNTQQDDADDQPIDSVINQHTDDVQNPQREDPTQHLQQPDHYSITPAQEADPVTTQPTSSAIRFEDISAQGPAPYNSWEQEPDPSSSSLPSDPPAQNPSFNPSPGPNTINCGLDDLPNKCVPEPSPTTSPRAPLLDQDGQHHHVLLPVDPPQSDYCEPTPAVGLDLNGSKNPNPLIQSDDEDMNSVKSDSGDEIEDDVRRDLGHHQQHEAPTMEMEATFADDKPQDIEMRDSEDEDIERPKRDFKERQSKADIERKKKNLIKTDNFLGQRRKAAAVH